MYIVYIYIQVTVWNSTLASGTREERDDSDDVKNTLIVILHLDDKEQGEGKGDANEKYREHNLSEDMSKIEKYYKFQYY